jgi:hypothetical protein
MSHADMQANNAMRHTADLHITRSTDDIVTAQIHYRWVAYLS